MYTKCAVRKIIISLVFLFISIEAFSQIPNFYRTAGKGKLYTYADVYIDKDSQKASSLTTFQYGITEHFAAGLKFSENSIGFVTRTGFPINKHIGLGLEITPRFDLHDSMKFLGLKAFLAANGTIVNNLFYCINTWLSTNKNTLSLNQYAYLGYDLGLSEDWTFSPLLGLGTRLDIKSHISPIVGICFAYKSWSFMVWTSDYAHNPALELCIDVRL